MSASESGYAPSRTDRLGPSESRIFFDIAGTQVTLIGRGDHIEAHCHGISEHFRADGGCEHMDVLLAAQRSPILRVLPFGGRETGKPCVCVHERGSGGWDSLEDGTYPSARVTEPGRDDMDSGPNG